MLPPLSDGVIARRAELAQEFARAEPFPHLVINDFFDDRFCTRLLDDFPPFEQGCALNDYGEPGNKAVQENVRALGPAFVELDDLLRDARFLALLGEVTGIPDLIYDPAYVGGGTHENRAQQDLDPHVDFNYHPTQGWERCLNLLVYLNRRWDESWGGCLELHRDPWRPAEDEVRSIVPTFNRCVVFATSERSWHGFRAITPPSDQPSLARRSFAAYFYRPRSTTRARPERSTIYVERPWPERIREGAHPTAEDVSEVERLLSRRAIHLGHLFAHDQNLARELAERVLELARSPAGALGAGDVAAITGAFELQDALLRAFYDREPQLNEAIARARTLTLRSRLTGALESSGVPSGLFSDCWVGSSLRLTLIATAPLARLELHGLVPK
ncbi:MAG TPA: 2OG-Fe(II) oxygenase, partial [Polyangia bacterium]|nr:2OG-Fe(II) oxygenase [Polyangia bacterium]